MMEYFAELYDDETNEQVDQFKVEAADTKTAEELVSLRWYGDDAENKPWVVYELHTVH